MGIPCEMNILFASFRIILRIQKLHDKQWNIIHQQVNIPQVASSYENLTGEVV